ncbi:F-box-like domain protein [Rhizoctonia solani 123E]|uniref:F-box-like domain protein n=1 Tax=Rhizoctonia solani 123E TaxID=1423351 RepID=A0A074RRU7_9AGAM|nr:F-box-like domain protein [Rhizoctonia solani 123E]
MLEDLKDASQSLRSALKHYLSVCSNLRTCAFQGELMHNRSLELADQVRNEVDSFAEYESQLQDAKVAIKVTQNHVPSIAPINILPPEILAEIFHLVLTLWPHSACRLAQVCSRWRCVALSTYSLWTHISYNPPHVPPKDAKLTALKKSDLLDHAKLHLCRSAHFPLHIHLSMEDGKYKWYNGSARSLFKCIASRMQSLQLSFPCSIYYGSASDTPESVVSDLLLNCEQDTFSQLVTTSRSAGFITPSNHTYNNSVFWLALTSGQLDKAFASIRVLHLHNRFPEWTSTAYHNLVDLRLMGSHKINEATLVNILKMSPGLCIFHFGLSIKPRDLSVVDPPLSVKLVDLELLRVVGDAVTIIFHEEVERILSWISPGKNALRLFIENKASGCREELNKQIPMTHIRAFFERSIIAELHAENYPLLLELTCLPITRHFALNSCHINNKTTQVPSEINRDASSPKLPLKTLYITNCSITLDTFRARLQMASVQRLVLYQNWFFLDGKEVSKDQVVMELSAMCLTVVFADEMPACISHWQSDVSKRSTVLGT